MKKIGAVLGELVIQILSGLYLLVVVIGGGLLALMALIWAVNLFS